jgi:hypothetical protein
MQRTSLLSFSRDNEHRSREVVGRNPSVAIRSDSELRNPNGIA